MITAAFVPESGCKHDDELGSIGQLYLDWMDFVGQPYALGCECAVEAGYYETVEECYEPPLPPPMKACIASVVDGFDSAAEGLECRVEQWSMAVDCYRSAGCDGDTYECYEILYNADPCPPLPYEAQRAVAEICYGVFLPLPFACGDGMQIPETYQCNGEPDCDDGSDEQNCPTFMCADGSDVLLNQQCDLSIDCPDASDEQGCAGEFVCDDGSFVVPSDYQCDGYPDCADGSDENGC